MGHAAKRRLGDIFVTQGVITSKQLQVALARQAETRGKIGEILVELGFVTRADLAAVVAEQWDELRASGRRPLREAAVVEAGAAERLAALTAELAERDRRIAELEATIAALRARLAEEAA